MAQTYMGKATTAETNAITNNNMGILTRRSGDRRAAMNFYGNASGAGSEVNYNKGLIQIQDGEYDAAIGSMNGQETFNTALVKMLNGDNEGASQAMTESNDESAVADYLRAIIAARSNDSAGVMSNITSAVAKDESLKEKAKKDLEFREFKAQFSF